MSTSFANAGDADLLDALTLGRARWGERDLVAARAELAARGLDLEVEARARLALRTDDWLERAALLPEPREPEVEAALLAEAKARGLPFTGPIARFVFEGYDDQAMIYMACLNAPLQAPTTRYAFRLEFERRGIALEGPVRRTLEDVPPDDLVIALAFGREELPPDVVTLIEAVLAAKEDAPTPAAVLEASYGDLTREELERAVGLPSLLATPWALRTLRAELERRGLDPSEAEPRARAHFANEADVDLLAWLSGADPLDEASLFAASSEALWRGLRPLATWREDQLWSRLFAGARHTALPEHPFPADSVVHAALVARELRVRRAEERLGGDLPVEPGVLARRPYFKPSTTVTIEPDLARLQLRANGGAILGFAALCLAIGWCCGLGPILSAVSEWNTSGFSWRGEAPTLFCIGLGILGFMALMAYTCFSSYMTRVQILLEARGDLLLERKGALGAAPEWSVARGLVQGVYPLGFEGALHVVYGSPDDPRREPLGVNSAGADQLHQDLERFSRALRQVAEGSADVEER